MPTKTFNVTVSTLRDADLPTKWAFTNHLRNMFDGTAVTLVSVSLPDPPPVGKVNAIRMVYLIK